MKIRTMFDIGDLVSSKSMNGQLGKVMLISTETDTSSHTSVVYFVAFENTVNKSLLESDLSSTAKTSRTVTEKEKNEAVLRKPKGPAPYTIDGWDL